jgi:diguanylate cyclase (GGDEF)-like protein
MKEQFHSQHKVLPLGPFIVDRLHTSYQYLIQNDAYSMLIDLPTLQVYDLFHQAFLSHQSFETLSFITIQHSDMTTLDVLNKVIDQGFKGTVITHEFIIRQIINLNIPIQWISIDQLDHTSFSFRAQIQFIKTRFLPYPDGFITYDHVSKTLFSAYLFSSYYKAHAVPSLDYIEKMIFQFEKAYLPSSEYIRLVMRDLEKIKLSTIYPSFGYLIDPSIALDVLEYVTKTEFFNHHLHHQKDDNPIVEINFIEIMNEFIGILAKNYPRIDVLNTFTGSPFHLDQSTVTLKKTSLVDYKLWHYFFEYIYAKKGITWLILLEPSLRFIMARFQLELPAIYRTELVKYHLEVHHLTEKQKELETTIESLRSEIESAKDHMLRDPITGLYLQGVLKEMMYKHFEHVAPKGKTRGIILIHLDQLMDINRRYGKETGNESLRNLVYTIEKGKSDFVSLFKQQGPGILAVMEDVTKEMIVKEAENYRNLISESPHFIDKVTASMAVVTCEEVNPELLVNDKVKLIFDLLEKRMALAHQRGMNELIDESYKLSEAKEGNILLVDQDLMSRNMLYRLFKRLNYEVILADSVVEAFQTIQKQKIDIVISEINLSKMDGFQLKTMLNESKIFHQIPFVMVSHNKTLENINRANTLDVDLILEKPVIPEELIGHIKRLKERSKMYDRQ